MILPFKASCARLSPDPTNNDKESYAVINPSFPIDVQPATAELTAITEGVYGQTFLGFTTYSGIALGDRITISGTSLGYKVKGVNNWNYGPLPHVELVLFQGDN